MLNVGHYKGVLVILFVAAAVFALTGQCIAEDEASELTLKPVSGKTVASILTPQRMLSDGKKVQCNGASGSIDVGGKNYKIVGSTQRGIYYLAVDSNNDGKLDNKEIHTVSRKDNSFVVSLENPLADSIDDDAAAAEDKAADVREFVLNDVTMASRGGKVVAMAFNLYPAWGMEGEFLNTKITLIDTNMDGLFTQDGSDAIATGSKVAVPLKKIHRIGDGIYSLVVSEDGKTISLKTQLLKLGMIQLAKPSPLWQGLIIENDDAAFNVLQDGKKGIPTGEYRILCGLLSRGKEAAFIAKAPSEDLIIKEGKNHKLRIGLPAEMKFQMNVINGNVTISPNGITVVGAAGETYRFNTQPRELPSINYVSGGRIIKRDRMKFG